MKKIIFLLLLSVFTHTNAQTEKEVVNQKELSLSDQFDFLYKKSGSYQDYKVVKIVQYNHLKQNVIDSLNTFKKTIKEARAVRLFAFWKAWFLAIDSKSAAAFSKTVG